MERPQSEDVRYVVRVPAFAQHDYAHHAANIFARLAGRSTVETIFRNSSAASLLVAFGSSLSMASVGTRSTWRPHRSRRRSRHGLRRHPPIRRRRRLALLAASALNLPALHNMVASGGWGGDIHPGIWKKTLGIVGMGRIGRALARRAARGFDMRVLPMTQRRMRAMPPPTA
jgi:hypothetical protein